MKKFQSTRPAWGATPWPDAARGWCERRFNPRAPHGARLKWRSATATSYPIVIFKEIADVTLTSHSKL